MGSQVSFSSSIRDDVVQTILTEIREQIPLDILLNSISNFAPKLLSTIAVVAKKHICTLFEETPFQSLPTSKELPAENFSLSEVHPSEEPPAEEFKKKKKKKKEIGFFRKFLRTPCCCCVSPTATNYNWIDLNLIVLI